MNQWMNEWMNEITSEFRATPKFVLTVLCNGVASIIHKIYKQWQNFPTLLQLTNTQSKQKNGNRWSS